MNSADASYDHGASYGTNHEVVVYDDIDRDTMRSKIKASKKTLVKAYISYSIYDSIQCSSGNNTIQCARSCTSAA